MFCILDLSRLKDFKSDRIGIHRDQISNGSKETPLLYQYQFIPTIKDLIFIETSLVSLTDLVQDFLVISYHASN